MAIAKSTDLWQSRCTFQGSFTERPVDTRYGNYRACIYQSQWAELEPLVSKYMSMCEDSQEACAELLLLSQYLCCIFLEALE